MISNMEKEIIEKLKKVLGYDTPKIIQNKFDNMVDYIIGNELIDIKPKELVWRLCGCYKDLNFNYVTYKDYKYIEK